MVLNYRYIIINMSELENNINSLDPINDHYLIKILYKTLETKLSQYEKIKKKKRLKSKSECPLITFNSEDLANINTLKKNLTEIFAGNNDVDDTTIEEIIHSSSSVNELYKKIYDSLQISDIYIQGDQRNFYFACYMLTRPSIYYNLNSNQLTVLNELNEFFTSMELSDNHHTINIYTIIRFNNVLVKYEYTVSTEICGDDGYPDYNLAGYKNHKIYISDDNNQTKKCISDDNNQTKYKIYEVDGVDRCVLDESTIGNTNDKILHTLLNLKITTKDFPELVFLLIKFSE